MLIVKIDNSGKRITPQTHSKSPLEMKGETYMLLFYEKISKHMSHRFE